MRSHAKVIASIAEAPEGLKERSERRDAERSQ